jgi:hypothetical protein
VISGAGLRAPISRPPFAGGNARGDSAESIRCLRVPVTINPSTGTATVVATTLSGFEGLAMPIRSRQGLADQLSRYSQG